jgi:hypothetical protein
MGSQSHATLGYVSRVNRRLDGYLHQHGKILQSGLSQHAVNCESYSGGCFFDPPYCCQSEALDKRITRWMPFYVRSVKRTAQSTI